MSASRRTTWKTLNEVADLIELLISCHPQGFRVLLGEAERPTPEEIHAMMDAQRDYGPPEIRPATPNQTVEAERIVWDAEKFDKVVEDAGGWFHITKISQEYKKAAPKTWNVIIDHASYVKNPATRLDEPRLKYVADKHGLDRNTVMKYSREFPMDLAKAILICPPDPDDFRLHSW